MVRVLTFGLRADLMGGIEKFVFTMAGHMKDEIVFDYVFLDTEKQIHHDLIQKMGGEIFLTPYYVKHPVKYVWTLYRLLRKLRNKENVIYVNLFSMVHILPVLMARMLGYKVMIHAHNNNIQHSSRIYHLIHHVGRWTCSFANCLRLTNSTESAIYMFGKSRGGESLLIYNAIDVAAFSYQAPVREDIRNEMGIADGTFVVGFSGRLDLQKNPLFVIDIFAKFHAMCPNSILLVAGEGPLLQQVEERTAQMQLSQQVKLLGMVDNMSAIYQAMDVFLLPSLFEGLGIVLVEAQASGLPCLTTLATVPGMVSVTPLVFRESLESNAEVWSKQLMAIKNMGYVHRSEYQKMVLSSPFNINVESKRFAGLIKDFVKS